VRALQTVMVLKYLVKDYPIQTLYFGIANVVANGLIMLRCVSSENENLIWSGLFEIMWLIVLFSSSIVLWVSQNIEDDYTYNLAL
jgi:hypothetical protein